MNGITQDEAEIYDRQIRLWGLDAQQRIRKAHVLVAGMRALSDEVCKNLALAGIGGITLLDHTVVTHDDLGAQFFLNDASVGMNRAEAAAPAIRALNPRVAVMVDKDAIAAKSDDYFEPFDIVCLVHQDTQTLNRVNRVRRKLNKPFYAADAFGWYGYIFSDLVNHTYIDEKEVMVAKGSEEKVTVRTSCVEPYVSLDDSLRKNWSTTRPKALGRIHPLCFVIQIKASAVADVC
ncbi:hypothetical protein BX666DRAFT_1932306 [Dichotomocladium elegans]|nr:hypothetical protein BX666DRAFT_1932306 [Dichotomocladium elegans]